MRMRAVMALCIVAMFMVLGTLSMIGLNASATTKNVRVKINHIQQMSTADPADSTSAADFYVQVYVGQQKQGSSQTGHQNDNDVISTDPGMPMQFDFSVTYSTSKPWITVVIEVWDDDGSGDNVCDISRRVFSTARELGTERSLVLALDLGTMTWTGDDGYNDGSGGAADSTIGYSDGEEWPDGSAIQIDTKIWFEITTY